MSRLRIFNENNPDTPEFASFDPDFIATELSRIGVTFERWKASHPLTPGATPEEVMAAYRGDIDRLVHEDGKLPAVGSTVDVGNATYTNTIGAPELIAVWRDPDFDPRQPAFYYGRVIEIPTPRWTAFDANRFGTKPLPGTRMTIQERAFTSPIWYSPA